MAANDYAKDKEEACFSEGFGSSHIDGNTAASMRPFGKNGVAFSIGMNEGMIEEH
ncbi:MAG: hypothetical protein RLZ87_1399 [Armatimonadota bacterium]